MQHNSFEWFLEPGKIADSQNEVGRRRRTGTWEQKSRKIGDNSSRINFGTFISTTKSSIFTSRFLMVRSWRFKLGIDLCRFQKATGRKLLHPACFQSFPGNNNLESCPKGTHYAEAPDSAVATSTVHVLHVLSVHYDEALGHFGR